MDGARSATMDDQKDGHTVDVEDGHARVEDEVMLVVEVEDDTVELEEVTPVAELDDCGVDTELNVDDVVLGVEVEKEDVMLEEVISMAELDDCGATEETEVENDAVVLAGLGNFEVDVVLEVEDELTLAAQNVGGD